MDNNPTRLDLDSVRSRLSAARGKQYWRCLDELAGTEQFDEFLHREFPSRASEWNDPVGRRRFLKLMGASLALAGFSGCIHQPKEEILPYVQQPEEIVLGKPLYFATAMPLAGVATGLLVESHEGRPTKIEGNPDHPATLGGTDAFTQASILGLYDPDRSQAVSYLGEVTTWAAYVGSLQGQLAAERGTRGAGIRILTETVTSPSLAAQIGSFLTAFPEARWHQYEPASCHNSRAGSTLAFSAFVNTVYKFDKAEVVLSLDSDFLTCGPGSVRYIRDFTSRRKLEGGRADLNRLYVVESLLTNTGAKADNRLVLRPSEIEPFARAVAAGVGVQLSGVAPTPHPDWVNAIVQDLKQHRGASIVIAGEGQPASVHALAHAINAALGNAQNTVIYTDPIEEKPVDQVESLRELMRDIDSSKVHALLIAGGNPVYNAPADCGFVERLKKVAFRAHLSLYEDETSQWCHWHVPQTHYLEAWADAKAHDGTISIMQPLIEPLYRGKSVYEFVAALTSRPDTSSYEVVRSYWSRKHQGPDFEKFWRKSVHDGFIQNTALPPRPVAVRPPEIFDAAGAERSDYSGPIEGASRAASQGSFELILTTDPTVFDGSFANNGWLQELPKPLTRLTWDNAALMSINTAKKLGISYEVASRGGEHGQVAADRVELEVDGRKVEAAAWIMPGMADDCIAMSLGYGRSKCGRVGTGAGFNAYALRGSDGLWMRAGLQARKIPGSYILACVQFFYSMEGRDLVMHATLDEYRDKPDFAQGEFKNPLDTPSLYPRYDYSHGYAWGMSIDLNACVGCAACVVACQAENNIPIVGKEEVNHGRVMHWLRVDRYFEGDPESPDTYFQPVPCMQCENAPCEVVCPVQATNHSAEGLNDMVYNRCVGTRYCSNNCPYKVRRFNFFQYADWDTPSLKLLYNPDVTVRSRGVMEKCTYCVQRISHGKIEAEKEGRQVRDGEIQTACQSACPANAITFGNINDPKSRVSSLKSEPRNYGLLAELNTRPRTTYLAEVRNPNPVLKKA